MSHAGGGGGGAGSWGRGGQWSEVQCIMSNGHTGDPPVDR